MIDWVYSWFTYSSPVSNNTMKVNNNPPSPPPPLVPKSIKTGFNTVVPNKTHQEIYLYGITEDSIKNVMSNLKTPVVLPKKELNNEVCELFVGGTANYFELLKKKKSFKQIL